MSEPTLLMRIFALRDAMLASPLSLQIAIAVVLLALVLAVLSSFMRRRTRRNQANDFLCERNRKALCDAVHSFYLSEPKADFAVTAKDLVARDMIKARNADCPDGRAYEISQTRGPKGRVQTVTVTCRRHGSSDLTD